MVVSVARIVGRDDRRPAPSTREADGRPQGAPPNHPATPVPTMLRVRSDADIVGTGVGWTRGVAPCGRPSSPSGVDNDGCPSSPFDKYCPPSFPRIFNLSRERDHFSRTHSISWVLV